MSFDFLDTHTRQIYAIRDMLAPEKGNLRTVETEAEAQMFKERLIKVNLTRLEEHWEWLLGKISDDDKAMLAKSCDDRYKIICMQLWEAE